MDVLNTCCSDNLFNVIIVMFRLTKLIQYTDYTLSHELYLILSTRTMNDVSMFVTPPASWLTTRYGPSHFWNYELPKDRPSNGEQLSTDTLIVTDTSTDTLIEHRLLCWLRMSDVRPCLFIKWLSVYVERYVRVVVEPTWNEVTGVIKSIGCFGSWPKSNL